MRDKAPETSRIKRVLFSLEIAIAAAIVLWSHYAMGVFLYNAIRGIF